MDYMMETFNPSNFSLNYNCRNTEQIARSTAVVSLVPPAKHMKITGPRVKTLVYTENNEFKYLLRQELISLFSGGTSPSDIVILSKYKYTNSGIFGLKSLYNLNIIENNNIEKFNDHAINYFTVQAYKGLESNIVFLIDIDGFENLKNRMLNYIAMSRAKIMLYLFYHNSVKKEYEKITAEGLELL
jgi:DNA helicase IV